MTVTIDKHASQWMPSSQFLFALLLFTPSLAFAGKTNVWRHASASDFQSAKLDGLRVSDHDELRLAPVVQEWADLKAASVWRLASGANGHVFAVTVNPSQLVDISPDGKSKVVWSNESQQAFSLCQRPDQTWLVGTGPEGRVYHVGKDGKASEFCRLPARYVWDLVSVDEQRVLAATGDGGKIYAIDAAGKFQPFFETQQKHVLALCPVTGGRILAGCDGTGLVFSIDRSGEGKVIFDAAEPEVRLLWEESPGVVLMGAAGMGTPTSGPTGSSTNTSAGTNGVYRYTADGNVRRVYDSRGYIYAAGRLGSSPGHVVLGTGKPAAAFLLDDSISTPRPLARVNAEEILAIASMPGGGLYLGTANPGKIYTLSADVEKLGTILSEPLDAKFVARFGAIRLSTETPPKTKVSVATRSGNSARVDESWSPWSAESTDLEAATVAAPSARFLQYRITLSTEDPRVSPTVRAISIRYAALNQPPEITSLTVPHIEDADGRVRQEKLKLAWKAADPNGDELRYTLEFRKAGATQWLPLKDNVAGSEFEWETIGLPGGLYEVRLSASDRTQNIPEEARSTALTSEPFLIDNEPPAVTAKVQSIADRRAKLSLSATDAATPIVRASYALDGLEWKELFPTDALFDNRREAFDLTTDVLPVGEHRLFFKATDAAGYTAATEVVIEVK